MHMRPKMEPAPLIVCHNVDHFACVQPAGVYAGGLQQCSPGIGVLGAAISHEVSCPLCGSPKLDVEAAGQPAGGCFNLQAVPPGSRVRSPGETVLDFTTLGRQNHTGCQGKSLHKGNKPKKLQLCLCSLECSCWRCSPAL